MSNFKNFFNDESLNLEEITDNVRDEALRLVEQAKVANWYNRMRDDKMSSEDMSESFKKAVIALQSKSYKGYSSKFDHLNQLMVLGSYDNQTIREN